VARIGNGQLAWFGTPVGYFIGSLAPFDSAPSGGVWHPPGLWLGSAAAAFAVLAGWRIARAIRAPSVIGYLAHPHRATLAIAVTFFSTLLTVGAWAYTDALADLARAMGVVNARLALRGAMVIALLGGAVVGGHLTGKRGWQRASVPDVIRCLTGGALLGGGAVLVPGSNDGLIMLGLPLLLPHAWLAVGVMSVTIAAAISISRNLNRPAAA
jgi:toxin CptA